MLKDVAVQIYVRYVYLAFMNVVIDFQHRCQDKFSKRISAATPCEFPKSFAFGGSIWG